MVTCEGAGARHRRRSLPINPTFPGSTGTGETSGKRATSESHMDSHYSLTPNCKSICTVAGSEALLEGDDSIYFRQCCRLMAVGLGRLPEFLKAC